MNAAPAGASGGDGHLFALREAAARVVGAPWLIWSLAAVFWARLAILASLQTERPDAANLWQAAHTYLLSPGQLHVTAAEALARTGTIPVAGHGFLYPATAALIALPIGLLPVQAGVAVWTLVDAAAGLGALFILYRHLRPAGLARPAFWLLAGYFPPLFADVDLGQSAGFLLLLACAGIVLVESRPVLAGCLLGLGSAIKFYPSAVLAGAGPRWRFAAALLVGGAFFLTASFIPLGVNGLRFYFSSVLLPATLHAPYPDCAIDSVKTLYSRVVGGEVYYLPGDRSLVAVRLPFLHLPALAAALTILTSAVLVAATFWAARRSGWHPTYGLCLGFSLGALLPAEVYPYQFLPLLPVLLLVIVRCIELRRWAVVGMVALAMLAFVRQPCELPFPNLWTLGALAAFAICACQNGLVRASKGSGS